MPFLKMDSVSRYIKALTAGLVFTISILIFTKMNFITTHGDDVKFPLHYQRFATLADYIVHRYITWTGRVTIEAVVPNVLIAGVWVWRFLNLSAFFLLLGGILGLSHTTRDLPANRQCLALLGIVFLIFTNHWAILHGGMFWATGSMNYLWPAACLCLVLIPVSALLQNVKISRQNWLLIIPAAMYGGYQEQASLIMVCFTMMTVLYSRFRFGKWNLGGMTVMFLLFVNLLVLLSAPGNILRYEQEIQTFFPAFNDVSLIEKIIQGVSYTVVHNWISESPNTVFAIALLNLYLCFQKTKSRIYRIFALLPLIYIFMVICLIKLVGDNYLNYFNMASYDRPTLLREKMYPQINLLPVIAGTLVMFMIASIWPLIFGKTELLFRLVLFYGAAVFSSFIITFSPTIFASGYRIFFIPNIMMTVVAYILFAETLKSIKRNDPFLILSFTSLTLFGSWKIYEFIVY